MSKDIGVSTAVAGRILSILDRTNVSVNRLARDSGIPRPTLDRALKVTPRTLNLGQIEDIASVLHVEVEELLGVAVPA